MLQKAELLESAKKNFKKYFDSQAEDILLSPAGLVLLGDHTHYNEGLLISSAVDLYTAVIIKKRDDNTFKVKVGEKPLVSFSNDELAGLTVEQFNTSLVIEILKVLKEDEKIVTGFDCYIETGIPRCTGLGYYTSIIAGFLKAINDCMNLNLEETEMIEFGFRAQKAKIGKIANRATIKASLISQKECLIYSDLRRIKPEFIPFETSKYKVILFDTFEEIINPRDICNERIDECSVGVKGLKLYIWGIKSLRDVKPDFLAKHVHMIPRKVYNRCLYNVNERERVTKVIESYEVDKFPLLGEKLFESHEDLSTVYELSTDKIDFLVSEAYKSGLFSGAKMISCSSYRSIFAVVKNENVNSAVDTLTKSFKEKYGEELSTYVLSFTDGINYN